MVEGQRLRLLVCLQRVVPAGRGSALVQCAFERGIDEPEVVELAIRAQDVLEDVGWEGNVRAPGVDEEGQLIERRLIEEVAGWMEHHAATGCGAKLILKIGGDPAHRGVGGEIQIDPRGEGRLVERDLRGGRIVAGQQAIEMAGDARRQQVGGRHRQHRAEEGEIGHPRPIDRLGNRHPIAGTVPTAGQAVEAEPRGPGVRHFVQLRRVVRVAGEGKQLRAAEAVGNVHAAAGETVEALGVVGFDLDVNLPNGRPWSPVLVKGAELEGTTAIPFVEVVGARARRNLLRIDQPVGWQRQEGEQFTVGLRQLHSQRLAVDDLDAGECVTGVAGVQW